MGRNLEEYKKMFLLLDLKNQKSKYLELISKILKNKDFETKITKTDYEFQKGANELLSIKVNNKSFEKNILL